MINSYKYRFIASVIYPLTRCLNRPHLYTIKKLLGKSGAEPTLKNGLTVQDKTEAEIRKAYRVGNK